MFLLSVYFICLAHDKDTHGSEEALHDHDEDPHDHEATVRLLDRVDGRESVVILKKGG